MTISRRQFAVTMPAALAERSSARLRLAICSETFQGRPFAEACEAAARCGYTGIEIEPAHLSSDPVALTAAERKSVREAMRSAGVHYAGLHSLLKAPTGLHLTTPDRARRRRSWEYFERLVELAADLGSDSVMVLGSAKQRAAVDGVSSAEATSILQQGLAHIAPIAMQHRVTILLEPLAPHLCNVVTTLEAAVAIVKQIDSPGLKSMFDTHNTAGENLPPAELLRKYLPWIRHIHLNEMDGRRPGAADYDFLSVLRQLRSSRYNGWVSVEVFEFKPDGETVARRSAEFLHNLENRLT